MFKIKTGYYLEFLTPETMEFLGSTKSKIRKYENDENVSYLEVIEVVLIQIIIEPYIHLFRINHWVNY